MKFEEEYPLLAKQSYVKFRPVVMGGEQLAELEITTADSVIRRCCLDKERVREVIDYLLEGLPDTYKEYSYERLGL